MPQIVWNQVDVQLRKQLVGTILGRGNTFSKIWLLQHIDFPSIYNECRLQIKQYYNGPCGAVASIQAWLVKTLLFDNVGKVPRHLTEVQKLAELRKNSLIRALSHILFGATPGRNGPVRLIVPFPPVGTIEENQYYESWHFATLQTMDELITLMEKHFENICHYGLSDLKMILSRGAERVHVEAAKDTLVDPVQEDCFQPLVNFILTGRAVSNVFDSPRPCAENDHPKLSRYGIISRSTIGFMTSVELFNKVFTVGNFYKVPFFPIWVIHGDFHYSVMFCECQEITRKQPQGERFFWYTVTFLNGLLLNKQYTLKVDAFKSVTSLAPRMEASLQVVRDCIRLRWPSAEVGILGVATEKKLCHLKHLSSSTLDSSVSNSR